jgi:hypothetical protein
MRLVPIFVTTLLACAMLTAAAAPALAQNCQALWVERNSYYKAHGYCFKTQRAIRYFGNGGCYIYDEAAVPLSPGERARIDEIRRLERALGCD